MVGTATTTMALSVQSVYTLWSLSADVVYVMLFPQLCCLFYLDKMTNTYGLICGVIVGLVTRVLCGEPSLNLPVVLKLPFYDEDMGQRFPHRTLCMSLNMATTVLGSLLWERLFRLGYVRKSLDYCRCFDGMTVLQSGDAAKEDTKPTENTRPFTSRADTKTANVSKATPTSYGFPYLRSLKGTDTRDNDATTDVAQPADPSGADTSRTEEMPLASSSLSSRAPSRAPSRTASVVATGPTGLSGKQGFKNLEADREDNDEDMAGTKISDTRMPKATAFTRSEVNQAASKSEVPRPKVAPRPSKYEVSARKPDIIVPKKAVADPSNQPECWPSSAIKDGEGQPVGLFISK
ncbi:hypothetical protein MTO96_035572 [Rhipicephalus appendiculatus]